MGNLGYINVGSFTSIPNVFFAPINPGFACHGQIKDEFSNFFIKHANKNIGICYIGNVAIDIPFITNPYTACFLVDQKNEWVKLTRKIKENGSLPGVQLAWKPSSLVLQKEFISKNPNEQIFQFQKFYNEFDSYNDIILKFKENINLAKEFGFEVIQLHAAHGYGLSLLLSGAFCRCNPLECKGLIIINELIKYINAIGLIADIRISLYEDILEPKAELEYKKKLIFELTKLNVNLISLSNGFYNINKNMIYPSKRSGPIILNEAINFSLEYSNTLFNVAGNMEKALLNSQTMPTNLTFSIGRQLMSDPLTIEKIKHGEFNKIIFCNECNNCHYYSYSKEHINKCM